MTNSHPNDDDEVTVDTADPRPVLLHSPQHAADLLDTSISSVRRLVRLGELEAVYLLTSLRITDRSVQRVAKNGTRRTRSRAKK